MNRPRLRPTLVGILFAIAGIGGLAALGASPSEIAIIAIGGAFGIALQLFLLHLIWKDEDE